MNIELANDDQDIDYFEQELMSLREIVEIPLISWRMEIHNPDPMEELLEVYDDVKEIESNLGRAIEIANFIIQKTKELLLTNNDLQEECEIMDLERITLEE